MKNTPTSTPAVINGIDTDFLRGAIQAVSEDSAKGLTHWQVVTHWRGGARSDAQVTECQVGGERIPRNYTISVDEPKQLGGTDQYANPQETLLAGLNACMIAGFNFLCSLEGIKLEELRIETEGNIDLRGLFALDPAVRPGYDQLRYTVFVKGDGTPEQFEKIHRTVIATSPNYDNIANAVPMKPRLVIGQAKSAKPQLVAA